MSRHVDRPLTVLADADVGYAVSAAAFGAFLHQGQICMSARRVIVDRAVADEFTGRLAEGIVHVNDQPVHDEPQMPFGA